MKCPQLRKLQDETGLVLASGSPRRKRILTDLGLDFEILIPRIDETLSTGLEPAQQVTDLARRKVLSLNLKDNRVYLGCDTIVVLDGEILNKPEDPDDARRILSLLSGRTHSVFTGLALRSNAGSEILTGFEESRVTFSMLSEGMMEKYIASGEPLDKAGAYGIQGLGAFFVDSVEGNIDNVIGLPVNELERLAGIFRETYDRR